MKSCSIVLGDQLFFDPNHLRGCDEVVMVESLELCKRLPYHKQKIAFILTSMREYRDYLISYLTGKKITYHHLDENKDFESVVVNLGKKYPKITLYEVINKQFKTKLYNIINQNFKEIEIISSPMFLLKDNQKKRELFDSIGVFKGVGMNNFYQSQRKKYDLLINEEGKPFGGKWTFDEFNRKPFKNASIQPRKLLNHNRNFEEVKLFVEKYFSDNPGKMSERWFAVNFDEVNAKIDEFFNGYLFSFGKYEDAMTTKDDFLYHSVLSPYLNNGMLTPEYLLERLMNFLKTWNDLPVTLSSDASSGIINRTVLPALPIWTYHISLSSVEGFIRQIIGWREWVKLFYDLKYTEGLEDYNYFDAHDDMPEYFWMKGLENLDNTPLKNTLFKLETLGWNHHIERLMILSNWCLLNNYSPVKVLEWFSSMYIDAYEWVMVPNVLGMGLFADGGLFGTKPYISGGNYIKKMSDFESGSWEKIWTEKYWNFIETHEEKLTKIPRFRFMKKRK